jgi:methionyl-tRNA formyltransferase
MLRLVFMGTPDFAVPTLAALAGSGHEIAAVYTRAPRPAGRGLDLRPSPVEREARRLGLAVFTPKPLRTEEAQAAFRAHRADAAVIVAYGLILPKPILDVPRLGCFNLHASALPRWRGAAPINRAIMAGDTETAATVMKMDEGLDTGPVVMEERIAIGPDMTAGELHDVLAVRGAELMVRALAALERGTLQPTPQPEEGATYAAKIDKGETRIDWTRSWQAVQKHCRGLSTFPDTWFEWSGAQNDILIKNINNNRGEGSGPPGTAISDRLTIACGEGAVRILELQRAGREPLTVENFLRGTPVPAGTRFM